MESLRNLFHFLSDVRGLVQTGGYVGLSIIVFIETGLMIGFFLPGDSLLVTAGLFAAKGDLNIVLLNALLMTCAVLGDATGYFIGRRLGPALFRREDSFFFKKKHLIATHDFYERHGGKTIIIARFVPVVRTFAPVVAGIGNMGYRRFAAYNIVGGVAWVFSMTMIGYSLIKIFPQAEKHIHIVILIVIVVSILPGIIEVLRAKLKKS
ncbi:MAG TPA: VTT domain-containing protein [Thermoanaerobaculia bacterium]|nr:VTT domain-containing protein [Thermoanaerobaculia bacterium]